MSVPATKSVWRVLAVISVVIFAYATVLPKLARNWWVDENYSHGLLIPFIIGAILWLQRDNLKNVETRPAPFWGASAIVLALVMLWSGVAGAELYTQRISLVLLLAGIVIYFWGGRLLKHLLVPGLLLLLAIPIPAIIFNKIAFPLQLFASRCAVWSMSVLGIPVLRQGNVIELKPLNALETKKLEVVEACSGIRSLMTLLTLAVVFSYFSYPREDDSNQDQGLAAWLKSYGFWRSVILVLSAIPIAILTNALRVSGTGVLSHYYGTRVADGFFHTFSGWVIYIVAFLMLFGVGWILDRFFSRTAESTNSERQSQASVRETATARSSVISSEGAD
jgi:exosortase